MHAGVVFRDDFKELGNSLGSPHYYDKAIHNITMADSEETRDFEHIVFDPRNDLPFGISIRLETLDCWVELMINKRDIKVSNGNH